MEWNDFPASSRIWIYNSTESFNKEETDSMQTELESFCESWTSHNNQLFATAKIFHNQFIVILLDESRAGASGCSIDKSVAFIKNIEQKYAKSLFNRMNFSYLSKDQVISLNKDAFQAAFESGEISDDTLVFDHLVNTKNDFDLAWTKPLKDSWHKRFV